MLAGNRYPGRGLLVGRTPSGRELVHLYWLTGRSAGSRNRRILRNPDDSLRTELIKPISGLDTSLLVYRAMAHRDGLHVTSNGVHTESVLDGLSVGVPLETVLAGLTYEPDPPLYTPRIMAATDPGARALVTLAIVRRRDGDGAYSLRSVFSYDDVAPGTGVCMTTYSGDGDPPPSYTGEPEQLPLAETPDANLEDYWRQLAGDNLVAVAVKHIDLDSGAFSLSVRNRYGGD